MTDPHVCLVIPIGGPVTFEQGEAKAKLLASGEKARIAWLAVTAANAHEKAVQLRLDDKSWTALSDAEGKEFDAAIEASNRTFDAHKAADAELGTALRNYVQASGKTLAEVLR